jgi:hypothetical protein
MNIASNVESMEAVWNLQEKCLIVKVSLVERRSANLVTDKLRWDLPADVYATVRSFKSRPLIIEVAFRGLAPKRLCEMSSAEVFTEKISIRATGSDYLHSADALADPRLTPFVKILLRRVEAACAE